MTKVRKEAKRGEIRGRKKGGKGKKKKRKEGCRKLRKVWKRANSSFILRLRCKEKEDEERYRWKARQRKKKRMGGTPITTKTTMKYKRSFGHEARASDAATIIKTQLV